MRRFLEERPRLQRSTT